MTPITIDKVNNRIWLWSEEGQRLTAARRLAGRWLEKSGVWTLPCDMHTCVELRRMFGDRLAIGADLWKWADDEKRTQSAADAIHALDAAEPVPLPNVEQVAPTMYAAMMNRGYQTIAAAFGASVGSHFNADQPGAGKTIETFGALIERGIFGRWLIIGPRKALQSTWIDEVQKWLAPDLDVHVELALAESGNMDERDAIVAKFNEESQNHDISILLVNPEATRIKPECPDGLCKGNDGFCENAKRHYKAYQGLSELFTYEWDAIVADETHKYLLNSNPRSKTVSQFGLGLQSLPLAAHGVKIGLSGTPFKGKPRRFWPVLHWLGRTNLGMWDWQKHFFETEIDQWTTTGEKVTDNMRADRVDEFNAMMARVMIRRTKSELRRLNPAWAPPDKRYREVWVRMDKKQAKQYNAMEAVSEVHLDGGMLSATGVLAEFTRLKQFAIACGDINDDGNFKPTLPSAKWDWMVEFLDARGVLPEINGRTVGPTEGEDKIIIASQYVSVLEMYAADLEKRRTPYMFIHGGTKNVDLVQKQWQAKYREGDARVMLLSTHAGGTSLTLDAADDVIMNDETWVPDDQEQVEDRAHRTSRTDHQVNVWYVRTEDTIERGLAGDNEWKDETQKRVLDGRRGVEYAKKVYNTKVRRDS